MNTNTSGIGGIAPAVPLVPTGKQFDLFALEVFRRAIEDGLDPEYAKLAGASRLNAARALARGMLADRLCRKTTERLALREVNLNVDMSRPLKEVDLSYQGARLIEHGARISAASRIGIKLKNPNVQFKYQSQAAEFLRRLLPSDNPTVEQLEVAYNAIGVSIGAAAENILEQKRKTFARDIWVLGLPAHEREICLTAQNWYQLKIREVMDWLLSQDKATQTKWIEQVGQEQEKLLAPWDARFEEWERQRPDPIVSSPRAHTDTLARDKPRVRLKADGTIAYDGNDLTLMKVIKKHNRSVAPSGYRRKTPSSVPCRGCGETIENAGPYQKWCSQSCRTKYKKAHTDPQRFNAGTQSRGVCGCGSDWASCAKCLMNGRDKAIGATTI